MLRPTVAIKPNRSIPGNRAVYLFPVAFFGTFFSTKESTINTINQLTSSNASFDKLSQRSLPKPATCNL
jgi:hypothetical protein